RSQKLSGKGDVRDTRRCQNFLLSFTEAARRQRGGGTGARVGPGNILPSFAALWLAPPGGGVELSRSGVGSPSDQKADERGRPVGDSAPQLCAAHDPIQPSPGVCGKSFVGGEVAAG